MPFLQNSIHMSLALYLTCMPGAYSDNNMLQCLNFMIKPQNNFLSLLALPYSQGGLAVGLLIIIAAIIIAVVAIVVVILYRRYVSTALVILYRR